MITFICIFFLILISVFILKKIQNKNLNLKFIITNYIIFEVLITEKLLLFIFQSENFGFKPLDFTYIFAVKYFAIIIFFLIFILPFVHKIIRNNIEVKIGF